MMEALLVIFILCSIYVIIKGTISVFKNHFWVALFMLIILTPLFILWAIFEGTFGDD
jgi:hypothetical protein